MKCDCISCGLKGFRGLGICDILQQTPCSVKDALAAHRERLEIELEGKNRVLEAERLEAGQSSSNGRVTFCNCHALTCAARRSKRLLLVLLPGLRTPTCTAPASHTFGRNEGRTEAMPRL